MTLKDNVAIVTGAASGIGRAIALELAAQQVKLILLGRRLDPLRAVAAEAEALGASAQTHSVDLESEGQLIQVADRIVGEYGQVHLLIHSAGLMALGPVESAPVEDLDRLYRVNLRAPYLLTQRLLPAMPSGQGQIVFVNSTAGMASKAGVTQYAATKHGLKALADGLRQELVPRGIRVLSVYPARTATPMQEEIFRMEQRTYEPGKLLQPEEVARSVMHLLLMPREAEVIDLAIRGVTDMSKRG